MGWLGLLAALVVVWFLFSRDDEGPSLDRIAALRDRLSDDARALAASGRTVEAVKAVRDETGATLREALATVRSLQP